MRGVFPLLSLALLAACRPTLPSRPNVVLIVVDTLRADALGSYGNRRGLTPFLDRWADQGTRFANAYAASSWTLPSVASLLTSRYPTQHRVTSFFAYLADDETTLAHVLHRHGWATAAFSANPALPRHLAASGFDTFPAYEPWRKLATPPLVRKSLLWVDRVRRETPGRPLFLYYQLMEPHAPYEPPEPYRARFAASELPAARLNLLHMRFLLGVGKHLTMAEAVQLCGLGDMPAWVPGWRAEHDVRRADLDYARSLYDGEVASLDAALRRLFVELDARGVLRHAIVVVTADHGEEFGDHGFFTHGTGLYNELIHVPLLLAGDGIPSGTRTQAVSLVDVAPTVLDLAGLPPEPTFEGRSLVPLAVRTAPAVDVVSELPETSAGGVGMHTKAVVRGELKLLALERGGPGNGTGLSGTEVYDLHTDPGELVAPTAPLRARAIPMMVSLRTFADALAPRARTATPTAPITDEMRDQLRALGYVN